MNHGILILSGIIFVFLFGTLCLILDSIYNKDGEAVYIKKENKTKPIETFEDNDVILNYDDGVDSNIF
jgi:hypothetical protein